MAIIFTTTSITLPLIALSIVWFRYAGIELRYLYLPEYAYSHGAKHEHLIITSQTTGRAHDSLHVPHDPDSHSEPEEMQVSWLSRALARTTAHRPVVREVKNRRVYDLWMGKREPHYRT